MSIQIKATAMWAQLERVNEMSGKYQIDLTQLSDAACKALESLGVEVKFTQDKGQFVTCKSTRPIYTFGPDGESLRGVKIGNGSSVVGAVRPYEWSFKNKSGVSLSLDRLTVTDLVTYEEDEESDASLDEAL